MGEYELLVGHIAYLATRIEGLVTLILELAGEINDDELAKASGAMGSLGVSIASAWHNDMPATAMLRQFHQAPPSSDLRDAAQTYEGLSDERQSLIVALVEGALLQAALFAAIERRLRTEAYLEEAQWKVVVDAKQAAETLLGLRCLISGATPAEVMRVQQQTAKLILGAESPSTVTNDPPTVGPRASDRVDTAAVEFDRLGPARYAVLDLDRLDGVGRGTFEKRVQGWFVDTALSSHPDKQRHLWKAIVGTAVRHAPWRPPFADTRPVSVKPAKDPFVRRATRVLAMVAELHKAGYQQVRISPGLSGSGAYWRCPVTFAGNIAPDGFTIMHFDMENRLVAPYTSANEENFFGWTNSSTMTARQLAIRLLEEYPRIAIGGSGRDWLYAGWLADVLGRAEQSSHSDLPIFYADMIDTWPAEWLPPPPLAQMS